MFFVRTSLVQPYNFHFLNISRLNCNCTLTYFSFLENMVVEEGYILEEKGPPTPVR